MSELPLDSDWRRVTVVDGLTFDVVFDRRREDPLTRAFAAGEYPQDVLPYTSLLPHILKPGAAVLDLGAHLGGFALIAAARGCRVLAVEACPRNAALLRASALRNGFQNLQVVQAAVSDQAGTVEFICDGPWGIVRTPATNGSTTRVPAVTVDTLLDEAGWRQVDLVKMDVEGSELAAVSGMSHLLAGPGAPVLIYESNSHTLSLLGRSPIRLRGALQDLGYRTYQIEPGVLVPLGHRDLQTEVFTDNLAVKGEPSAPPGWRLRERFSRAEERARVVEAAASADELQRLYLACNLPEADSWMCRDDVVLRAVQRLRHDPSERVRQATPRWERPSWSQRVLGWWRDAA